LLSLISNPRDTNLHGLVEHLGKEGVDVLSALHCKESQVGKRQKSTIMKNVPMANMPSSRSPLISLLIACSMLLFDIFWYSSNTKHS
jgi:hypothetical protein